MSRQLKTLAVKVTLHNHLLFTCKTCLPVETKTVNTFLRENYWLRLWQKLSFLLLCDLEKKNPLLSKWIQEAPFGKNSYCFKRFHKTTLILLLQKGYNLFVSLHSCLPHSNCDYIQIIKSCLQYDRITASPAVLIGDYLYLYINSALQNDALEGQLLIHLWLNVWGVCFLHIYRTSIWIEDQPFSSFILSKFLCPQDVLKNKTFPLVAGAFGLKLLTIFTPSGEPWSKDVC